MNEQLIKFIELCLMDGVISEKEREVIFRKSKELGVPEDECEIILKGMIQQKGGEVQSKEVSVQTNVPVSNSFEEKEPELIKREVLNKQTELESSISKNKKQIKETVKEISDYKKKLKHCLSYEIVNREKKLCKTIKLIKSYEDLLDTSKNIKTKIEKINWKDTVDKEQIEKFYIDPSIIKLIKK